MKKFEGSQKQAFLEQDRGEANDDSESSGPNANTINAKYLQGISIEEGEHDFESESVSENTLLEYEKVFRKVTLCGRLKEIKS
jgi:hypothetical protein